MVTIAERNLSALPREAHAPFLPSKSEATIEQLRNRVRSISHATLQELVTEDGIYASTKKGKQGMYHGFFGRDSTITEALTREAVEIQAARFGSVSLGHIDLVNRAIRGTVALSRFQGKVDDPHRGEEVGKRPHEIRFENFEHLTNPKDTNTRPWFVDVDGVMKSWDSVDATSLSAFETGRLISLDMLELDPEEMQLYRNELQWCLNNLRDNGGFIGFIHNPNRKYGGLINQNWMDSEFSMRHQDRRPRVYPMKPVEAQGITWAALKYGARNFERQDPEFARTLGETADVLKSRFNGDKGFWFKPQEGDPYLAEAIDGSGHRVENITCNPAFLLWANFEGQTILEQGSERLVAQMLVSDEMFSPEGGIRTYNRSKKVIFDPVGYHEGPETYWLFIDGIAASGLNKFGFRLEARKVALAAAQVINQFGSCVELVQKKEGRLRVYRDPKTGQESAQDQAWSAATGLLVSSLI